jgi:hypothetical protein
LSHDSSTDEAARVVGDAGRVELAVALLHLHVGAGGEHGVQVRRDEQLGAVARALAQADDVAFGVDLRVREAQRLHAREEGFGALLLLEGRRFDLGEHLQVFDRALVVGLHRVQQLLDRGRGHQLRVGLVDSGRTCAGVAATAPFWAWARPAAARECKHERSKTKGRGARHGEEDVLESERKQARHRRGVVSDSCGCARRMLWFNLRRCQFF